MVLACGISEEKRNEKRNFIIFKTVVAKTNFCIIQGPITKIDDEDHKMHF